MKSEMLHVVALAEQVTVGNAESEADRLQLTIVRLQLVGPDLLLAMLRDEPTGMRASRL